VELGAKLSVSSSVAGIDAFLSRSEARAGHYGCMDTGWHHGRGMTEGTGLGFPDSDVDLDEAVEQCPKLRAGNQ
jgi:hypothetical protein